MYLRELRLAQMERMMEEFLHGVDIYLSCIRDAPDDVVKKKVWCCMFDYLWEKND